MLEFDYPQQLFKLTMNHVRAVTAVFRRVFAGTLSWGDCRLLFCVSAAESIALTALDRGSIRGARRVLARLRPLALAFGGRPPEQRVIWALAARGRWFGGGSTCLGRALVAELLLETLECPLTVVIGVAAGAGGVRSHAWIERNGHVLVGGDHDRRQYLPLVAWGSAAP
jgi:Transglutaminase-like superfamily